MMSRHVWFIPALMLLFVGTPRGMSAEPGPQTFASHPPLQPLPALTQRPLTTGPHLYVDPSLGNDEAAGTEQAPWNSVNHALKLLKPGDTLVLRGGVYREQIYCAVSGTPEAPITIRAAPGERVFIDGGLAEFFDQPATAWEPFVGGGEGEYRSVKPYKNVRDVLGLFGDSHVGLQTYWHTIDLRATNELWTDDPEKKLMVLPIYCGPGIWYDRQSGHIHARLAHTNLKTPGLANYRGETDPRKLPLIIAPFNSVPLKVDMARYVRFQDLVIRGGGLDCVVLQMGIDIDFDNVTVYAGTYGIRAQSTGPFRMTNSAIHGMLAPWSWRDENSLFTYTPKSYDPFLPPPKPANERNICRMNTHALLVTEGFYEFEVFAYPFNHDWDISYCDFTDGHDGVYLSGKAIKFHHNIVEHIQDDGIYLSSPATYITDDVHIYENLLRDMFSVFGCHSRGGPVGEISIYRNLCDQRQGVPFTRPTPAKPEGNLPSGHGFLVHGGDLLGMESLHFYQNTFVTEIWSASYAARLWTGTHARGRRSILNNLFVYMTRYPESAYPQEHDIQMDGNLHWCPVPDAKPPEGFLEKVRHAKGSLAVKAKYPTGWEANSLVADPHFVDFSLAISAKNDYRLKPDSPALGRGVVLPKEFVDPLRPAGEAKPDIGAFPLNSEAWGFGRHGRVKLPVTGNGSL